MLKGRYVKNGLLLFKSNYTIQISVKNCTTLVIFVFLHTYCNIMAANDRNEMDEDTVSIQLLFFPFTKLMDQLIQCGFLKNYPNCLENQTYISQLQRFQLVLTLKSRVNQSLKFASNLCQNCKHTFQCKCSINVIFKITI